LSSKAELQRKLSAGIAAAKQGDRDRARRLLEEATQIDDRSEQAWLWLATVANTQVERSAHLRKVLTINPRNTRAREALVQLQSVVGSAEERRVRLALGENARVRGDEPSAPVEALRGATLRPTVDVGTRQRSGGGGLGIAIVLSAVALIGVGVFIALNGSGILTPGPTPINTPVTVSTSVAGVGDISATNADNSSGENVIIATDTPSGPTQTAVPLDLVTRQAPTLPPPSTATITPTLTPTPQVTAAFEIGVFEMFYVSQDPAVAEPDVYSLNADGSNDGLILESARDFAFAPDGERFAFVRDVLTEENGVRLAEVFVGSLADPAAAERITDMRRPDTGSPSWSPDGTRIVFASGGDLFIVGVDGQNLIALTNTVSPEREPAWSPSGDMIVYTGDIKGFGFTDLFVQRITPEGDRVGDVIQATDSGRSSYGPRWSPDSAYIVFASDRTGDGDIYVMNADGTNEVLLSIGDGGAEDRSPSVSPDGLWIAFMSNRDADGRFQTYTMRFNGTDLRLVTNNPRTDLTVVWRPFEFPR
jgi:TolB protein